MLTARDVLRRPTRRDRSPRLMTPRERLVTGGPARPATRPRGCCDDARVEKLPLVADDDRLVG